MPITIAIEGAGLLEHAECQVEEPSKSKASKKGLKVFGYTWLGAIITLFIPIVHFVTVPAALFLGPLLGFLVYRNNLQRATIICSDASCPACHKPLALTFASDVDEVERSCKSCGTALKVKACEQVSS